MVAFGKLAEVMGQWLKKGRPVYIEGRLQTRSWEQDGTKRYRTEIVADNFQFGPGGGGSTDSPTASEGGTEQPKAPDYPEEEINPEDIPF